MTNFTKEELEFILDDLEYHMSISRLANHEFNRDLVKKIRDMIDNYCEHETVVPNWDCKTQCAKCDVIL